MRSLYRRLRGRDDVADRFVLLDGEAEPPPPDPTPVLRRVAAETVILQDEAEAVIRSIKARESLGWVAPRAGPLVRRFFALRDELPTQLAEPGDVALRAEMAAILHHHALALSVAMDFLANEWRSSALSGQVDGLTDLGPPARRMDEICTLLVAHPAITS